MRKIWIDCDPGLDDAVALIYGAAHASELKIMGISTVAGNQTIDKVTANAQALVKLLKLPVTVAKGASAPLVRELVTGANVHGETGLGSIKLPEGKGILSKDEALEAIYRCLQELPKGEKLTLVALGPLTNVALLLQKYPQAKESIEELIFMGGAAWGGNVTASAEFNVYVDPEAAKYVLEAGIPTVMCGLDVTMKCGLTRNQIAKLCQNGNTMGALCAELLGQCVNVPTYQVNPVIPAHDTVPLMYLICPEIFGGEKLPVTVDCSHGIGRGHTICDRRYLQDEDDLHVKVLLKVDGKAFQEKLIDSLFAFSEIQQ